MGKERTDDGRPSLSRFMVWARERARIESRRERRKGNDEIADRMAAFAADLAVCLREWGDEGWRTI